MIPAAASRRSPTVKRASMSARSRPGSSATSRGFSGRPWRDVFWKRTSSGCATTALM
jgi:hypothetical protein